jgi:hypothetical protein
MLNAQQETHPYPETSPDNASSSHDDEQSKGASSSSGTGTSGNANAPEATDEYGEMQKFQASETKRVNVARRFVLASILIVGSFVSILIYMILRASVDSDKSDAVSCVLCWPDNRSLLCFLFPLGAAFSSFF